MNLFFRYIGMDDDFEAGRCSSDRPGPTRLDGRRAVDLKGRLVYKKNKARATPQAVPPVKTKEFLVVRALSAMTGTRPR